MAVKEGHATAVMSSYNYIGPVWSGACAPLQQTVLRDEWGFRGMVITDYFLAAGSASSRFPDHSNRSDKKGNGSHQKERTERAATAKEICLASEIHAAKKEVGGTYLVICKM